MSHDLTEKLVEIANLFTDIKDLCQHLSTNDHQIVYLFFSTRMDIREISRICELPPATVRGVVGAFLTALLSKCDRLRVFLDRWSRCGIPAEGPCRPGIDAAANLEETINRLITDCGIQDSVACRMRDIVGTTLQSGSARMPVHLCAVTIAKVNLAAQPSMGHIVKFPIVLADRNFFLGRIRIAAGTEAEQLAATCSDGSVVLERGSERMTVNFRIALLEQATAEYAIAWHNLPNWAIPASFSFTGPDKQRTIREFDLPAEFREGRLCVRVENGEQELAFLDRVEACIGFIVSEKSEG
jgi:hypothetical protein